MSKRWCRPQANAEDKRGDAGRGWLQPIVEADWPAEAVGLHAHARQKWPEPFLCGDHFSHSMSNWARLFILTTYSRIEANKVSIILKGVPIGNLTVPFDRR